MKVVPTFPCNSNEYPLVLETAPEQWDELHSAGTGSTSSYGYGSAWSDPGNITASDDTYASGTSNGSGDMWYLIGSNFGFGIPSGATIDKIEVKIEGYATSASTYASCQLLKAGVGVAMDSGLIPTTEGTVTVGDDNWGVSWSAEDINDSGFGVRFTLAGGVNKTAYIDHLQIKVYYTY
jgi:hypothetical protein